MVKGLELFKEHFEAYTDQYILIGGTACDIQFSQKNLSYRVTKDLDIIIIVESLTDDFVRRFWEFIRVGEYAVAEVDSRKCFYRFINPAVEGYPKMLELFARRPDMLAAGEDFHITDIPTGEEASSLSAILMDEDYYRFTLENSDTIDGLHVAHDIALIALKCRAFLNNRQRRQEGQKVQEVDIVKHRNDVIKLTATIAGIPVKDIPAVVKRDIEQYIEVLRVEKVAAKALLSPIGFGNITIEEIIERLEVVFGTHSPNNPSTMA